MWYAIYGEDVDSSLPLREKARARHLLRVRELINQGRLLVAGPHPAIDSKEPGAAGFTGSLIIAEFSSLQDAEHWIANDPYVTEGVFRSVIVRPYNVVLP